MTISAISTFYKKKYNWHLACVQQLFSIALKTFTFGLDLNFHRVILKNKKKIRVKLRYMINDQIYLWETTLFYVLFFLTPAFSWGARFLVNKLLRKFSLFSTRDKYTYSLYIPKPRVPSEPTSSHTVSRRVQFCRAFF